MAVARGHLLITALPVSGLDEGVVRLVDGLDGLRAANGQRHARWHRDGGDRHEVALKLQFEVVEYAPVVRIESVVAQSDVQVTAIEVELHLVPVAPLLECGVRALHRVGIVSAVVGSPATAVEVVVAGPGVDTLQFLLVVAGIHHARDVLRAVLIVLVTLVVVHDSVQSLQTQPVMAFGQVFHRLVEVERAVPEL